MNKSSLKLILGFAAFIVIMACALYFLLAKKWSGLPFLKTPVVITETITLPDTKSLTGTEGWNANKNAHKVAVAPEDEGEKVIVTGAIHSPYTAYELVKEEAASWSDDARLAVVRSLGTVTTDGISIGWQLIFYSAAKKTGYEILVNGGSVAGKKEVPTDLRGGAIPENWKDRDASWAIARLAENPQWKEATMTGLNFVYSQDAKAWEYVIANSFGGSSVRLR